MNDDFLLKNEKGRELYDYAKSLPVFDYHCHLSPEEIFKDKEFKNLSELWLDGDHYKWRIMRAYGIDEKFITGNAEPYSKFEKFCEAMPYFIGNPVYHWAHLELKIYFGLDLPLCSANAEEIWHRTSEAMADGKFSARKLIERSGVVRLITTDNPCDPLKYHNKLNAEKPNFKTLPCFRADNLINIEDESAFKAYIDKLSAVSGVRIGVLDDFTKAVEKRLDYFLNNGCVCADVSFLDFPDAVGCAEKAARAFERILRGDSEGKDGIRRGEAEQCFGSTAAGDNCGKNPSEYARDAEEFRFYILSKLSEMLADRGMVMQYHTGVMRNCNGALYRTAGRDAGGDSVYGKVNVSAAARLLSAANGRLPKTIIYTLNPAFYYPLATLLGDFQGGERGKLQLGAAWWFADHRDGITEQLKITAATGGLGLFNGMLTDSRSFTSYARHDYFRRILCSLIGEWVENGEYPDNEESLKNLIYDVCFGNANRYFGGGK